MPLTNKFTIEQEDFLAFVKEQVAKDKDLLSLMTYCVFSTQVVFSQPLSVIRRRLKQKIVKGTKTYGTPRYDAYRLRREFEEECIDLIGWTLVDKWNKLKECDPSTKNEPTKNL